MNKFLDINKSRYVKLFFSTFVFLLILSSVEIAFAECNSATEDPNNKTGCTTSKEDTTGAVTGTGFTCPTGHCPGFTKQILRGDTTTVYRPGDNVNSGSEATTNTEKSNK